METLAFFAFGGILSALVIYANDKIAQYIS